MDDLKARIGPARKEAEATAVALAKTAKPPVVDMHAAASEDYDKTNDRLAAGAEAGDWI